MDKDTNKTAGTGKETPEGNESKPEAVLGQQGQITTEPEPTKTGEIMADGTFIDNKGIRRNKDGTLAKGSVLNPAGKLKGTEHFSTILDKALRRVAQLNKKESEELFEEIIGNAILQARGGNYKFYRDMLDRLYGKPRETVRVDTNPITKIEVEIIENKRDDDDDFSYVERTRDGANSQNESVERVQEERTGSDAVGS